jgi:hypothetical protein
VGYSLSPYGLGIPTLKLLKQKVRICNARIETSVAPNESGQFLKPS